LLGVLAEPTAGTGWGRTKRCLDRPLRSIVLLAALALGASCQDSPEKHDQVQPESPAGETDGRPSMMDNGMNDDEMMGDGMMNGRGMMGREGMGEMMRDMPEWMMSGEMRMDGNMMRDMRVIRGLLMNHEKVRREVEEIPGGVRTVTTSNDPEIARLIRTHVHQMKDRMEEGHAIRHMDPLFRELFEHHEKIEMEIENVPGGGRVTETSDDSKVTSLIRQHARKAVSEFVERGMRRAMQPTPLPDGYQP